MFGDNPAAKNKVENRYSRDEIPLKPEAENIHETHLCYSAFCE